MKKTREDNFQKSEKIFFGRKKHPSEKKKERERERETERPPSKRNHHQSRVAHDEYEEQKDKKGEKGGENREKNKKKKEENNDVSLFVVVAPRFVVKGRDKIARGGGGKREREREKGKDAGQSYRACVPVSFPRALSFFFFFNASL